MINGLKILIIMMAFPLIYGFSYSQSFVVFQPDQTNYPQMSFSAVALDTDGSRIKIQPDKLKLSINGTDNDITSVDNPENKNPGSVSVILSFDISASMGATGLGFIDSALVNFSKHFDFNHSEVAVTAFNQFSYFLTDFTNKKNIVVNSINGLNTFGSTSFDAAFTDEPAGAFKIVRNAAYTPIIIILTDGTAFGNEQSILDSAKTSGAVVYAVSIFSPMPELLKKLCSQTHGCYFDNISQVTDLVNIYRTLSYLSQEGLASIIKFDDNSCDNNQSYEIIESDIGQKQDFSSFIPDSILPHLDFGSTSSIQFGSVTPGSPISSYLSIKAVGKDIIITGVEKSSKIDLLNFKLPDTIKNGTNPSIQIRYNPQDTLYFFDKIKFITNACSNNSVLVSAGSDYDNKPKNTLTLDFPQGGDILTGGTDTTIKWSGVTENDLINIEFTTDNGQNWLRISKNAAGLKFNWGPIPKIQSQNCLMRIKKLSPINNENKILKINSIDGKVVGIKFSKDGDSLFGASSSGFIRLYNTDLTSPYKGEPIRTIVNNKPGIDMMDVDGNDSIVAYHVKDKDFFTAININVLNSDKSFQTDGDKITSLAYNPTGKIIIAGTDNGNIYFWEYPNPNYIIKFKAHDDAITTLRWNFDGTKYASGTYGGYLKVWNGNGDPNPISAGQNSPASVTSLSWDEKDEIATSSALDKMFLKNYKDLDDIDTLINNLNPVFAAAVNPHGTIIVSSSIDTLVKLWNLSTRKYYYVFSAHSSIVNAIAWDKSGKRIATGSNNGELFIWSPDDIPFEAKAIMSDSTKTTFSIGLPAVKTLNLNFKEQEIGIMADTLLESAIKNTGSLDLKIDSIVIIGAGKADYTYNKPKNKFILKPGNSYDVQLFLIPKNSGIYNDTIVYYSGINQYYSNITASVIPDLIEIKPKLLDFGSIDIGSPAIKSFIIKNLSSNKILFNSTIIAGPDVNQFSLQHKLDTLNPNATDSTFVVFTPQKTGAAGSLAEIRIKGSTRVYSVTLSANAVGPIITADSILNFKTTGCEIYSDTVYFKIKNDGNATLFITKTSFSTNDFKILEPIDGTSINPGDESDCGVIFNAQSDGIKSDELIITTNQTLNSGIEYKIKLTGSSYRSDFSLDPGNLLFSVTETNRSETKDINIHNKGLLPITWRYLPVSDYFEIVSFNPQTSNPGESSVVTIRFIGSTTEGTYADTLHFRDSCGNDRVLDLLAYVGKSNAKIDFPQQIDFGSALCSQTKDSSIFLKNTGSSPLLIDSITLNTDNFEIEGNYNAITVIPDGIIEIKLKFIGSNSGINESELTIYAVSTNSVEGKFTSFLHSIRYKSSFNKSPDTLLLKTVENVKKSGSFKLINTGNTSIYWNLPDSTNHFTVVSIDPESSNPGDTAIVKVKFLGGRSGETFDGYFDFIDACGNTGRAYVRAEVNGFAQAGFGIGDYSGSPGDTIAINLKLFSPQNEKLPSVIGYSTDISFDGSLLAPLDPVISKLSNGIRTISLTNISPQPGSDSTAATLHFLVTLGDTSFSPITISNSKALDDDEIVLEENPGKFDLTGYCTAGGSRFVLNTDRFFLEEPEPNPASGIFKIKFTAIEKGRHIVAIHDLSGNEISVFEQADLLPGDYELIADASKLAQGIYYISLQTPSYFRLRKLVVVR